MGDLNLPLVDWKNNTTSNCAMHSKFLTFFTSNSFSQLVNFPTRESNILDLILVDDPTIISDVHSTAPIGSSDHLCVMFNLELTADDNNSFSNDVNEAVNNVSDFNYLNLSYYYLNKADWVAVNEFLSGVDWNDLLMCYNSIDDCWDSFYALIVYAINLHAPVRRSSTVHHYRSSRNRASKRYKYYPKHIRKLCSKKVRSWRRYKARPSLRRRAT